MSLLFKLQNIGFALSVGTLGFLAVNVEPAKAQRLDTIHNNGNSAKAYCQSKLNQRQMNHFWGSTQERTDTKGRKYTRIYGYILHNNDAYSAYKLEVYGNTVRGNYFAGCRKGSWVDIKTEYEWCSLRCVLQWH